MVLKRDTCTANVAIDSIMKVFDSNESEKISTAGSSHQVADIQVEVPETVPEETVSWAVTRAPVKISATKKLKKYVNATKDDFEIDLSTVQDSR